MAAFEVRQPALFHQRPAQQRSVAALAAERNGAGDQFAGLVDVARRTHLSGPLDAGQCGGAQIIDPGFVGGTHRRLVASGSCNR
jgi:hypothetical protein